MYESINSGITYTYSKSFKFLFYPKMISLILLNNKSERFDLEGSDNDVSWKIRILDYLLHNRVTSAI